MTSEAQLADFTSRFETELTKYNLKGSFCNSAVAA
jgi:hypothetical protein